MPRPRREPDLLAIRRSIDRIGRASDALIRVGPFSLGIDGVLSWIPVVGEAYSGAAAALILVQGARARAPLPVLLTAAGLLASRTAITAIPLAGPAISDMFLAHKWASRLLVKAIDRKLATAERSFS